MSNYWKGWFAGIAVLLVMFFGSVHVLSTTEHLREKKSRTVSMVAAYEYLDKCGHKGRYECSAWKGRFHVMPENKMVTRPIDGFFYHKFIENGSQPLSAYVPLSKVDLGVKEPKSVSWANAFAFFSFMAGIIWFFVGGFIGLFDSSVHNTRHYRSRY